MNSKDVSLANDYAKARDLRNELRRLEELIARRADRSPVTLDDERRMHDTQVRADSAYSAANRRAPPAMPLERPDEYRRRLAEGLQVYSPSWRGKDLSGVTDETALKAIERQIFADAVANGRTFGLKPHEICERVTKSPGGHKVIEYDGGHGRELHPSVRATRRESAASGRRQNTRRCPEMLRWREWARSSHLASASVGPTRRVLIQFGGGGPFSSQPFDRGPALTCRVPN